MQLLPSAQYGKALRLYQENAAYFPLIVAVLDQAQDGAVYANSVEFPKQIYVEHAFGFAQVFGEPAPAFEQSLQHYLLIDKAFGCTKVRLYTPRCPEFLMDSAYDGLRSWRQHFQLDSARKRIDDPPTQVDGKSLSLLHTDADIVNMIEDTFGVVGRFWRSREDFAHHANAVVALVEGQVASLCYAAAVAGGMAEIDVLTLPAYRHLGLAKVVVNQFKQRCLAQSVLPLWDCFINNTASMALCQSTGFVPLGDPYPFFTINR